MKYYPYNMQRMFLDFSPDLLAGGAEWCFSENPVIKKKRCYEDPSFHEVRTNQILEAREKEDREKEQTLTYYQATEQKGMYTGHPVTAELCIDEERGEFVRSWCSCNDFRRDFFTCKHVAGLAVTYLMDKKEALEGSEIERLLKEKTKDGDPFRPGRLRKTSNNLKPFMSQIMLQTDSFGKPAWQTGERKSAPEMLNMDIYASAINDALALELRIGTRKPYQIKSLDEFFQAYETNSPYNFSNSICLPAGRENFVSSDQQILDLLCQIRNSRKRKHNGTVSGYVNSYDFYNRDFTTLNTAQQAKLMLLFDQELDNFMELYDGHQLLFTDAQVKALPCKIDMEKEPAPIRIEKTEFGANMQMEDEQLIACGFNRMYIRQGEEILSLPAEQWDMRKNLRSAFAGQTELYIQDRDLPAVATSLYELSGEKQKQALMELGPVMAKKESPQIQIFLDYPQENMVSCQMKAKYPSSGKSYDLFSQSEDPDFRNLPVEQAVGEKLWAYFDAWNEESGELIADCEDDRLYQFLVDTIPSLSKYGEVLISDRLKRLKAIHNPVINVGLQVDAGSLLMSLHSNEISKEEIIEVLSGYNRKKRFTRLKNGTFITNDESNGAVLEALAESFRAYGKNNPEAMKLPLFRALYMDELLKDRENIQLSEGADYISLLNQLQDVENRDYQVPESLSEILRPYQKDGYCWMRMLKDNGFGGILADDMGLGKTLQVLTFILADKNKEAADKYTETADASKESADKYIETADENKESADKYTETADESIVIAGKCNTALDNTCAIIDQGMITKGASLIIAPASLVYNWQKEIRTFTPELTCKVIAGTAKERKNILAQLRREPAYDVYITSYDLLKRDIGEYEGIHFENQIIDEAQYIKNQSTQAAKAVRLIESTFRMALTGTPIENRLSELWSIFDYIMPGFLYSYTRFRDDYESPVINNHDEEVMERLRKMVHPFILRRLKKDVLKDLPDKLEESISVLLEGEQRKVYDAYAERLRLYLDKQSDAEYRQSKLEILAELTKLRQICCGPELFLDNYKGKNAKLEACMEIVNRAIDGGHKILLFSQFTKVLDQLGKRMKAEKIAYYRIDGSTPKEERMKLVDAFQNESDKTLVFCISLKAGGTGLNLTAADIVIHYDPWWNLAAQNQATDRTHRIGQQNTVTVYSLIAEDTIEEQITLLQKTKAQLAEDILSGEGISSIMIHKDDLLALL